MCPPLPAVLRLSCLTAAGLLLLFLAPHPVVAEEPPLLSYAVDVVSNHVSKGEDAFLAVDDKEGRPHGAFRFTPAVQPSVVLLGSAGFSLSLAGAWALTDREPEPEKGFAGLETLDEVGYTLAWAWANRLGRFSSGWVLTTKVPQRNSGNELFLSVEPAALDSVGGRLKHSVVSDGGSPSGATYTQFELGGGEGLTWGLALGLSTKLQEVTGTVGHAYGDVFLSAHASYRPHPELFDRYDQDGKYQVQGALEQAPPVLYWLTLTYAGKVER